MEASGLKPADFTHAIFHQPNTKFPQRAGKELGFSPEQIKTGLLSPVIGNTYAGASLIGLSAVLDEAQPGDLILMTSYGSGAGSDSFILRVRGTYPGTARQGALHPGLHRPPHGNRLRHLRPLPR
jgi:3-hydroxy-3-methylglutaryl CoA synthase